MKIAPSGLTAPQAGVMATRPATTPEAAPREVAWPSRIFSTTQPAEHRRAGGGVVLTQTSGRGAVGARARSRR